MSPNLTCYNSGFHDDNLLLMRFFFHNVGLDFLSFLFIFLKIFSYIVSCNGMEHFSGHSVWKCLAPFHQEVLRSFEKQFLSPTQSRVSPSNDTEYNTLLYFVLVEFSN